MRKFLNLKKNLIRFLKAKDFIFINRAFGMIEALIGISVASVILVAFTTLNVHNIKISRANTNELRASMYLQEMIEAAKDLEQSDWEAIVNSSCFSPLICHPEIQGGNWVFVSGSESLDDDVFVRSLSIEDVHRNQLIFPNEIVSIGGEVDPNTKKIITTITWNNSFQSKTLLLETYVYNYTP